MNLNRLKLLAIFAIVVEQGSFAAAARQLHSSRSRISEQITQLEEMLGIRLFHRSTRQLSVTEDGKVIYERARDLQDILVDTDSLADQSIPKGRVSITTTNDVGINKLLPCLKSFQTQYPEVFVDVRLEDERTDLIAEGIDLAIRVGVPKDDRLIARVLYRDHFQIVASPDYLERNGTPKNIEELEQHSWISLDISSSDGVQRFYKEGKQVQIRPKSYYSCNSPLMMQQMVLEGIGITAVLPSTMQTALVEGQLVPLFPELQGAPLEFYIVYPSRRQLPSRTRCLIDHLIQSKEFQK
ncbi:LysR family transcriptional regulator [Curvivirga aplysinae]|uniref:LysR family transcriptional regulator n=1 Tax=Curvivirga aplysinae TaxID=2529852 RepID=UPI0012BBB2EB|nr:LysR family transcriptional regulator [Curvivirga aplysinae]MTI10971.1 LysR family transcriptional regulator [Curvivirga aplysinae]